MPERGISKIVVAAEERYKCYAKRKKFKKRAGANVRYRIGRLVTHHLVLNRNLINSRLNPRRDQYARLARPRIIYDAVEISELP